MTGLRSLVTSIGTRELCIFSIKIPTHVNSFARPCSPRGLFCGSHSSATSYSNGLTGEEEEEGRVEMSWLMGQWHAVSGGFMSQSKSEYWKCDHCVTLAILRIIWQCIMLEICHAKKMPSPVAEITACGAVRSSSPPHFVNSLWTTVTQRTIDRGPPHLVRVSDCQNKW